MDDWYQDNRCNYKTILYPQWRVYRLGSAPAQSRELWVSSEHLTYSDSSHSNAFLASPGHISWSGIFLLPRRASIPGIRTFRSLPIPLDIGKVQVLPYTTYQLLVFLVRQVSDFGPIFFSDVLIDFNWPGIKSIAAPLLALRTSESA